MNNNTGIRIHSKHSIFNSLKYDVGIMLLID